MAKVDTTGYLCFLLILFFTATSLFAGVIKVRGFAPGSQEPAVLNAGLQPADYGYHPDNDGSYGESWSISAGNTRGDLVYVLMSISNYHPLHKFGGTVDLFYYAANGEKYEAHQEFKSNQVQADRSRVMVHIGDNVFQGQRPSYRLQTQVNDLKMDLSFSVTTPDLWLGQGRVLFGEQGERYWLLTVLGPHARVSGTVTAKGRSIPFQGLAYFDHGWSTYKLYSFSSRWYVVRMLQDDFALNAVQMNFKSNFAPRQAQAVFMTLGDRIIANSGALQMTPMGEYKHEPSGLVIPSSYQLHYELGGTKLTGTVKMTRLVEGLNVLQRLSPVVRKLIQTLVTDPWQFRFMGQADLTLTYGGQTRKITGTTGGEVHHYK